MRGSNRILLAAASIGALSHTMNAGRSVEEVAVLKSSRDDNSNLWMPPKFSDDNNYRSNGRPPIGWRNNARKHKAKALAYRQRRNRRTKGSK